MDTHGITAKDREANLMGSSPHYPLGSPWTEVQDKEGPTRGAALAGLPATTGQVGGHFGLLTRPVIVRLQKHYENPVPAGKGRLRYDVIELCLYRRRHRLLLLRGILLAKSREATVVGPLRHAEGGNALGDRMRLEPLELTATSHVPER